MQRVRMSLPYFKQFGWEAEVVTVNPAYTDLPKDELLIETIPAYIKVHTVKAFNKRWTSKLGFGNIAFRSYRFYSKKVDELLKANKFDLIYFSTTQFPICILGAYWKKQFGIPYVIDMQDPWHSEYYRNKPKHQQPPKYWLSYRLNKFLEPLAMKLVDGLISVSESYIDDLKDRYPEIKDIPSATITFGSFMPDLDIAKKNKTNFAELLTTDSKTIVYIGRGGVDMHSAITPVFKAFKQLLTTQSELYSKVKFYFIGTSYAPIGEENLTILPLAKQFGIDAHVIEVPQRISYFNTLVTLQQADALFIPGSDDPKYTASKIYPYLMVEKPLLAVFNAASPALNILKDGGAPFSYSYDSTVDLNDYLLEFFDKLINNTISKPDYNKSCIEKYSAQNMTKQQCDLFNRVLATQI
jgi:glycosyltransferase involved in cell wall biosynthesis